MLEKIKIMVVDDTITYRSILSRILRKIDGVEVVGSAANGKIALEKISLLKPDMITLDIEMPIMDGLETLKHLTRDYPGIGVVMVSSANPSSADQTIKALGLGSIEFIVKPDSTGGNNAENELLDQLRKVISLLRFKLKKPIKPAIDSPAVPTAKAPTLSTLKFKKPPIVNMVLIGSSTGGPKALEMVIPKLPINFPAPVLIVQHMPKLFTNSLAMRLDELSAIRVKEGEDMEIISKGCAYIAPGGVHMTIEKNLKGMKILKMNEKPPENSCRPSVDTLFRSSANLYSPNNTLCVILTGMGADGMKGVKHLRNKGINGGYCLTQSEESCVVYGMPRAIVDAGLNCESIHLNNIADRIVEITIGRK